MSCNKQGNKSGFMPNAGFMSEPGTYRSLSSIIIIKKYEDGSLTYGISDKKFELIYQHSVFSSFSDNQYWFLYKDEKENIWFYSSDIQESKVLLKDSLTNKYSLHDFCIEKIKIPPILLKELLHSNNYCFRIGS